MSLRPSHLAGPFVAVVLLLATAAPAAADVVVPDDQIVQGNQCVGVLCADGEAFGVGNPPLTAKSDDTPGIRFVQTRPSTPLRPGTSAATRASSSSRT